MKSDTMDREQILQQNESAQTSPTDRNPFAGYGSEEIPLGSYATLMAVYAAGFAGFLWATRAREPARRERLGLADLLTLGIATHKLSRLLAKDWVTSPLRAPFTEYQGTGEAPGEVSEQPRGKGMQLALGQLFT